MIERCDRHVRMEHGSASVRGSKGRVESLPQPFNSIALRQSIAQPVIEAGRYVMV